MGTFLGPSVAFVQVCGIKNFKPPPTFDRKSFSLHTHQFFCLHHSITSIDIELPDRPKLRFVDKVPPFPPSVRPPKMQKRLRYMRGPEDVHTFLLHKQYAIVVCLLNCFSDSFLATFYRL